MQMLKLSCVATGFWAAAVSIACAQSLSWDKALFPQSAMALAASVDLRDTAALSKKLGVAILLRPYCGAISCEGETPLGLMHAFPDPRIYVPGKEGVWIQYLVRDGHNPPLSQWPLVGTLSVLDLFAPPT